MSGMHYVCPHCGHEMDTAIERPEKFVPVRQPELFHRCDACRRYALPEGLDEYLRKQGGYLFSGCINADHCRAWGNYDSDCESGQLMPKCLFPLHAELDVLRAMLRPGPDGRPGTLLPFPQGGTRGLGR